MKLPRDISGVELARMLKKLDYAITRQTGSHMRITTEKDGQHHETIPCHDPLKTGTLHSILKSVAEHHHLTLDDLLRTLGY